MSRLSKTFQELKAAGKAAFIPFFAIGDPDLETSYQLIKAAGQNGADVIELGIPFSDPIADGPVIQSAFYRALDKGFKVAQVFEVVRRLRQDGCQTPLVCMVSYSLVYKQSVGEFCRRCAEAGVDALIIPDLPAGYEGDATQRAAAAGLDLVFLVAPTTTPERRELIAQRSRGFIYYISVAGITGTRSALPADLAEQVKTLRARGPTPVCVGFGISSAEQARVVAQFADGVIVGSAIVRKVEEAVSRQLQGPALVADVSTLVAALARGTHQS